MVLEAPCGKKETEVGDVVKDKSIKCCGFFKNKRVEKKINK